MGADRSAKGAGIAEREEDEMNRILIQHGRKLLLFVFMIGAAFTSAGAQQIAFTWDDLPAHSVLPPGRRGLRSARRLSPR